MDDIRFRTLLVVSLAIILSILLHLILATSIRKCCYPVQSQTEETEKHKNDEPPLYEIVVQDPPDYSPPEHLKRIFDL